MNVPIFVAADALLPIRIIAVIALFAVIVAFVYLVRHLKRIERTIATRDLVPAQRGPRNNLVLIVCAVPIIVTGLLVFLILKT